MPPWSVYKFLVFQGLLAVRLCAFAITFEKVAAPPVILCCVFFTLGGKVQLTPYWPSLSLIGSINGSSGHFGTVGGTFILCLPRLPENSWMGAVQCAFCLFA